MIPSPHPDASWKPISRQDYGIAPFARSLLRLCGWLASSYAVFVFWATGLLNPAWGVLLVSMGLVSLYFHTGENRLYYSPLFFTLYFFLGYILDISRILLEQKEQGALDSRSLGAFQFTNQEFAAPMLTIGSGLAAIMAATLLAERFLPRIGNRRLANFSSGRPTMVILHNLNVLWFVSSCCVIFLLWFLGIGRTGLAHESVLPFKLAGILSFVKSIVLPFTGLLLLGISLSTQHKSLFKLQLVMLLLVGVLGSLGGTSRGYVFFVATPPLLYLFLRSYSNDWRRRVLFQYALVLIASLVLVVGLVQKLRDVGFGLGRLSITDSYTTIVETRNLDFVDLIQETAALATSRIGGVGELLKASSAPVKELYAPWAIFVSDGNYITDYLFSVYGFSPDPNTDLAFGIAYGFFGMFALSGNYLVVFAGVAISCLLILYAEDVFLRLGPESELAVYFLALYVSFQFWGNIYLWILIRMFISLWFSYIISKCVLRMCIKRDNRVHSRMSLKISSERKHHV